MHEEIRTSVVSKGHVRQVDVPPDRFQADGDAAADCSNGSTTALKSDFGTADEQLGVPRSSPPWTLDQQQSEAIAQIAPGGMQNIQDVYPLAPLQEGMLFHHLLNEQSDTYVLSTLFQARSHAQLRDLVAALQQVVDRHDILRTSLLWEGVPRPLQIVHRRASIPVQEFALDRNSDPIAQLKDYMKPGRFRLNVRQAPLLRLQVAADPTSTRWYAILYVHHLVCDHQSLRIVVAEALACLDGRESSLPVPAPFRSYVEQTMVDANPAAAEEFFKSKLAEVDEPTAPFGLLDVHGDGSQIAECSQTMDADLAERLRRRAQHCKVSAARMIHAAWGLVVARTSGRADVVYGTVLLTAAQRKAQARRMLGLSVNTLPLRLRLQDVTAEELVAHTHQELRLLSTYEATPLAAVQRCSGITGSAPLFTSLLNYRHSWPADDAGPDNETGVRVLARGEAWTNYPITITVDDFGDGFGLMAKSDRSVEPQRLLSYLCTALRSLMEALERAPRTPALMLSVLPKSEQRQLIDGFNATHSPYLREKLLHELFEAQVEHSPDAVAVVHERHSMTYAELNRRSNQLASYLRTKGVGPDKLVALCLERSVELVIGLLGILKAGGAYVPLDPTNPRDRLEHLLSDARPEVLITSLGLLAALPSIVPQVITLDGDWERIARQPDANIPPQTLQLSSSNLAYVIYTSGSTGRPKGVMVEHRNIVNYTVHALRQFDVAAGEGALVCTSISFDLMLTGLYPTLACGRTVRLCRERQGFPDLSHELLRAGNLSPVKLTPSHLALLEPALCSGQLAGRIRVLVLGGETLQASAVSAWRTYAPDTRIFNHYGPTETTVGCIVYEVPRSLSGVVPIGRPIANTQIYILDERRQVVPIGVVGEIYVGGYGVTRGYLNRPELTAERFVPNPFSDDPQARLYKTGDLGRWRCDGTIDYLGRSDQQVKIRGFRVEPTEVEVQLRDHEQLKDAVVVMREDVPGEKRLVAYVIPRERPGPTPQVLRAHLAALLPEYMIPAVFVLLDSFPLTPNGKLNRRALPAPEQGAYSSRGYEPTQGETESVLAAIWSSLLGVERIGRHDNFFELGGHSLLVIRMIERMRQAGFTAGAREAFASRSLAELAEAVTSAVPDVFETPASSIAPDCAAITPELLPLVRLQQCEIDWLVQSVPGGTSNVADVFPLLPLQEGILFHHSLAGGKGGDMYVVPVVLSVQSRERLDALATALQATIDRHDILRTAVLWEQLPRPVQVVYRRATLELEIVSFDPQREPLEQIKEWLKAEHQWLDPRHAPMMRLRAAVDDVGGWHALLQTHHLIADHVTLEVMISELVAHLGGHARTLSQPVPYRSHVARVLAASLTQDTEAYFRARLGDIDEPTAPFDLSDARGDGSLIEEASESIGASLSQRVRAAARNLAVSAATLLHAAWSLVVAHTSRRDDVVFGTVVLGRLHGGAGAQRTLGLFINTLPLRIQVRDLTVKKLVECMQRELLDLLNHEHASLATVQRCSGVIGAAPLFTALLNYRHSTSTLEEQWSRIPGVRAIAAQGRTNYPITLSVDDLQEGFKLTAQTDWRLAPRRLIGYMHTAINSIVVALEDAPETPAMQLSILPSSERFELLELLNPAPSVYPHEKLVHEMFEEQVLRTPFEVAATFADRSLTYSQLNEQANRLARYLLQQGVAVGEPVAICVERSLDMVVSLLAILKAGAAYLPLDPNYPPERLQYMLEDARPRIVLTEEKLQWLLEASAARVVAIDAVMQEIAGCPSENLSRVGLGITTRDLVYVIYTSGSTGQPKGTAMPHGSMANLLEWHRVEFVGRLQQRVLQFAALSFDVAFQEVFSTLCFGGTLVLLDEWVRRDARALLQVLLKENIQRLFVPPLMLQSLAECCSTAIDSPSSLCDVITAGEQLRVTPEISAFFAHMQGCRLHNHYGPTETHVVTALTLSGDPADWPALPSIGRPIANTQIYLLDERGQLVPFGVAGEIYIGGANVARGYLNRSELTALRFVADPFGRNPHLRLYRTGDLGRWQVGGTIEYLGRNDDQVKIRGYRIELGEIEARLLRHHLVSGAAVIARDDRARGRRLVAYVTCRDERRPSAEELRVHLQESLPDYMIPSAIAILERLPLTPSGKLDRRALLALEPCAQTRDEHEVPRGEVERALAGIWEDLLGVEMVGRQDNFFELGGHSLLASRVMTHVSHVLEVELPVRVIFDKPTIAQLGVHIHTMREGLDGIAVEAS
jgi:amino acid adenylation domain-containing protein